MIIKAVLFGGASYCFGWKKVTLATVGTVGLSYYFYNKHMYQKEQYDRLLYVITNDVPLSGVRLQQRGAFPSFGPFTWLFPFYHQSLQFVDPKTDTVIRQVGLGKNLDAHVWWDLRSEFVSHQDKVYKYLNRFETSIPIECWVDYRRQYGHYPENIDVNVLKELTRTRDEPESKFPLYETTYLVPIKTLDDKWTVSSCQSAVWYVIRKEELLRT
jgi:hypothetical protein